MGGKSDKTTQTQQSDPWKPSQGALTDILSRAQNLNAQGTSYYPGSTVAGFSNDTQNAMSGIRNMANSGSPLYGQGSNAISGGLSQALSTANGDYLNNNPYLHDMFSALSGDVQNSVNSQFSAAGRTGSPAHAGVMTQQLGNLGAQIYGQNYANERQNQMQAVNQLGNFASMIPGYDSAKYNDLNALSAIGAQQEGKTQQGLTEDFNRYMFNQQSPWDNLLKYGGLAQGIAGLGGQSTGTQEQQTSALSQIIGLLSASAGAAKSGAEAYAAASDRSVKENIIELNDDLALDAIKSIPSYTYTYKLGMGDSGREPRIGPMAQDWASEFGGDGKVIPMPQMMGAMFSALKAIAKRLEALEARV